MKKIATIALLLILIGCARENIDQTGAFTCTKLTTVSVDPPQAGFPYTDREITLYLDITQDQLIQIILDNTYRETFTNGGPGTKTITRTMRCLQ